MSKKCVLLVVMIFLCFSVQTVAQAAKTSNEAEWKSIEVSGLKPEPRYGHAMVFMSKQGKVLMFGGRDLDGNYFGDTWEWDVVTRKWTLLSTDGPKERAFHAMAYDPKRDIVVMQGGRHNATNALSQNDLFSPSTWIWTGKKWEYEGGEALRYRFEQTSDPSERGFHSMVYDTSRDEMVLFGGYWNDIDHGGDEWWSFGDTWVRRGNTWIKAEADNAPRDRSSYAMVYDPKGKRVLMHGGDHLPSYSVNRQMSKHIFAWNGKSWDMLAGGGPEDREGHRLFIDPSSGDVLTFGGVDTNGNFSTSFWRFKGNAWEEVSAKLPLTRKEYAVATDTLTNKVWMWGGITVSGGIDDRMWYFGEDMAPLDLEIDRVKPKSRGSFISGDEIELVLRTRNISKADSADYSVEVFLSLNKTIDDSDIKLLNLSLKEPLEAGKKRKIKALSEIPADMIAGKYWLIARLTSSKPELNETNNHYASGKRIVIE